MEQTSFLNRRVPIYERRQRITLPDPIGDPGVKRSVEGVQIVDIDVESSLCVC
jgi:hypothetical protein